MIKLKEGQKVVDVEGNVYLVEKNDMLGSTPLEEKTNDIFTVFEEDGNIYVDYGYAGRIETVDVKRLKAELWKIASRYIQR